MPIDPGHSDYIKRRASAWNKATGGQSGLASSLFASQIAETPQQEQELISNPEFREYAAQQQAAANKEQPSYVAYGPEFEVAAEAPAWLKTQRNAESRYPVYKNSFLQRFAPDRFKQAQFAYEQRRQAFIKERVAADVLRRIPYERNQPADKYMAALSPKEREYLAGSSAWDKTSKTYWDKVGAGILGANPATKFLAQTGFLPSPQSYTRKELGDVSGLEAVEGVGGLASKPIQGLLNKLGVTDFKTQDGKPYDFTDALKGRQNDAGFIADMATDLTNLIGAGMANRFARLMKAGNIKMADDLIKAAIEKTGKKYIDIAEGENIAKIAWKSPADRFDKNVVGTYSDMQASKQHFEKIQNKKTPTKSDIDVIKDYEDSSFQYSGRYAPPIKEKKEALEKIVNSNSISLEEPIILSRRIDSNKKALFNLDENGVYNPNRVLSFSAGRDAVGNAPRSGASDRIVVRLKSGENSGFMKNEYWDISDDEIVKKIKNQKPQGSTVSKDEIEMWRDALARRKEEREILSSKPLKLISKVKNNFGGYDFIMKPLSK